MRPILRSRLFPNVFSAAEPLYSTRHARSTYAAVNISLQKYALLSNVTPKRFYLNSKAHVAKEEGAVIAPIPSISRFRDLHTTRNLFSSKKEKVVPFLLADIGEGITECEVTQWFVKPGDKVAQFDKICEVQSDKAVVEISSRFDGVIQKLHFSVNDIAKVGTPLVDILVVDESATATAPVASVAQEGAASASASTVDASLKDTATSRESQGVLAAPAVRRIAREKGINLNDIKGTGLKGRILKEDLDSVQSMPSAMSKLSIATVASPERGAEKEWMPLSMTKKAMVKAMTQSLQIPHFVYTDEIRMDPMMKAKSDLASTHATQPKLTYLPFMLKACSLALLRFPELNAKYTDTHWQPRGYHHIGVAMDTPQGLLVPNVAHVENHSVFSLATSLLALQEIAMQNKLLPVHFQNTTFTLSNIGAIGGDYMHPVIPFGQVCIVATGKIRSVPRCVKDAKHHEPRIEVQNVMPISISADHRYVDGATVARFVQAWKSYLENPMLMLAHLK